MDTAEASARFQRELRDALARLVETLRRRLRSGDRQGTVEAALVAESVLDDLNDRALAETFRRVVVAVVASVGGNLEAAGIDASLSGPGEAALQQLAGTGVDAVTRALTDQHEELRRVLVEAILGAERPEDAIAAFERATRSSASRVAAVVDTALFAIDRGATLTGAEDAGVDVFLYEGPVDSLTRDWCARRVGKLFRRDELDREENETGPQPPSVFGGGYNCRHRWTAVPLPDVDAEWYYPQQALVRRAG